MLVDAAERQPAIERRRHAAAIALRLARALKQAERATLQERRAMAERLLALEGDFQLVVLAGKNAAFTTANSDV